MSKYAFRGLPCTVGTWSVDGVQWNPITGEREGVGVLEWCYDEDDARHRLSLMQEHPNEFSRLSVGNCAEQHTGIHPLIKDVLLG